MPKKTFEETHAPVMDPVIIEISDRTDLRISPIRNLEDDTITVDLRLFVKSQKYTGPSPKGFGISLTQLKEFIDELVKVEEQLIEDPKPKKKSK